MTKQEVLRRLESMGDAGYRSRMKEFGIKVRKAHGVSVRRIRMLAKQIGTDHKLAEELWKSDVHEARTLATLIADPKKLSKAAMDRWVKSIDSWDICDAACGNLFDKTPHAYEKAKQWVKKEPEYVRRAGFVMMANLAVHDKSAAVKEFRPFLKLIRQNCDDDRNFVKKSATWALRQIGKRSPTLCREAIGLGEQLVESESKTCKWVGRDALRELQSDKVQSRWSKSSKSTTKKGKKSGRKTSKESKSKK